MSNHTPGPWYFHEQGSACFYAITHFKEKLNSVDWLLSLQHNGEQLLEEERANMCLIAAAPELLHELQKAHRTLRKTGYNMANIDALFIRIEGGSDGN